MGVWGDVPGANTPERYACIPNCVPAGMQASMQDAKESSKRTAMKPPGAAKHRPRHEHGRSGLWPMQPPCVTGMCHLAARWRLAAGNDVK